MTRPMPLTSSSTSTSAFHSGVFLSISPKFFLVS